MTSKGPLISMNTWVILGTIWLILWFTSVVGWWRICYRMTLTAQGTLENGARPLGAV
jgi:hypothetical protein